MDIIKTKLYPENNKDKVLYPETSASQIPDLLIFLANAGITNGKGGIKSITSIGSEVVGAHTLTTIAVTYEDNTTQNLIIDAQNGESIYEVTTQGSRDVNGYTETEIDFKFNNGDVKTFTISAKNGENGQNGVDGNSISSIHTLGHTVVGDETVTTVQVTFTNAGSPVQTFEIHSQNGENGSKLYQHIINIVHRNSGTVEGRISIAIINDNSNQFDYTSLVLYLRSLNLSNGVRFYPASGNYIMNTDTKTLVFGVYGSSSLTFIALDFDYNYQSIAVSEADLDEFVDKVIEY